jgi:endoglucanase
VNKISSVALQRPRKGWTWALFGKQIALRVFNMCRLNFGYKEDYRPNSEPERQEFTASYFDGSDNEFTFGRRPAADVTACSPCSRRTVLRANILSIVRSLFVMTSRVLTGAYPNAAKMMAALVVIFCAGPGHAAGIFDGPAINVATWFTWPRYQAAPATGIEWPPYKADRPGEALLTSLHAAGFKTIRLAVDPSPLIFFEGQQREALVAMFKETLGRLKKAGFNVIFDFAPNSRHSIWGDRALLSPSNPTYLNRYADLVREMSRYLSSFEPGSVALELINEPRVGCKGADQARWQDIVSNLVMQARAGSKTLPIVVSGGCASTPDGLIALNPKAFDDKNIFYTFHYYEPFSFTHQGAQFIPWADKYLDQVPWPYSRRPIEEPTTALHARLAALRMDSAEVNKQFAAALNNLNRYYAAKHDAHSIESKFSSVKDWAVQNNIEPNRVFVGEFGVWKRHAGLPGALCVDRAAWIGAVRQAAEQQHFGWVFFHLDGPFGIVEPPGKIDPVVLHALGLGPPAACPAN